MSDIALTVIKGEPRKDGKVESGAWTRKVVVWDAVRHV